MAIPLVGRNVAVAVDGYDFTGNGNEIKLKRDAAKIDATVFGQHFSYDLAGIQKASLELKGFYSYGYSQIDQIINQRFGQTNDVNVLVAPAGYPVLGPAILMPSVITKYDLDAKLKGAIDLDAEFDARGALDQGFILNSPIGTTTTTGNSTDLFTAGVDTGGATTGGAAAHVHVFGVTGTTPSFTAKIQHSPDGTTWTDLLTFAAITTANSNQRLTAVNGITVNSHVRASWTISGTTPAFNALIGFSRSVVYT